MRVWALAALVAACGGSSDGASGRGARATDAAPASAAAAARAASGSAAADSAPRPSPATVLFIGTSLTAGLGLDPADAYPSVIQRLADSAGFAVEVVNAGLSGETSAGALRRADWVLRRPADLIVLETGANDGLRGLDPDSTQANVRALVRKVKTAQPAARVLLVQMEAPPNLGPEYTARFREVFPAAARAEGVTLVPFLLEGVAGEAGLNQPDGIHPNEEGAERVAANVWAALRPVLDSLRGQA